MFNIVKNVFSGFKLPVEYRGLSVNIVVFETIVPDRFFMDFLDFRGGLRFPNDSIIVNHDDPREPSAPGHIMGSA